MGIRVARTLGLYRDPNRAKASASRMKVLLFCIAVPECTDLSHKSVNYPHSGTSSSTTRSPPDAARSCMLRDATRRASVEQIRGPGSCAVQYIGVGLVTCTG